MLSLWELALLLTLCIYSSKYELLFSFNVKDNTIFPCLHWFFYFQIDCKYKQFLWLTQLFLSFLVYDSYAMILSSVYSTRTLFHKYFVAMKSKWICKFLIVSESPSLKVIKIPIQKEEQLYKCTELSLKRKEGICLKTNHMETYLVDQQFHMVQVLFNVHL